MGQLVVAAGAALVLGPAGLALTTAGTGFAIGSIAYSLLNQPKYQGPRLSDLTAPKVDEGSIIPIVEGHPRVPGIPIWQDNAIEHEHTEGGGKGGPSQTTYSYTRHVLYLVADGEIGGVAQAFENGKLVWTNLADADEASLEASADNTRFSDLIVYTGADDQDPDPTYEAAVGVGMAPAYTRRGTVMLLDVACDSGGRIGQWTFVVNGQPGDENTLQAKLILSDYAAPPTGVSIHSRGASVGNGLATRVCGIAGGNVVTYAGKSGGSSIVSHTDAIPPTVQHVPGRGTGDRAFCVFGTPDGALAGFAIVGDGISQFAALQDNTDYLGTQDIRWSTRSDRIAIGSAAAIGTGAQSMGGVTVAGAKGKVYLYDLNGNYLDSETIGSPIESIAMSTGTVWALSDGDVYPFTISGDTLTAGASFAAPAGSDHALVVSSGGVLHAVNDGQQVYARGASTWSLVTTLDAEDEVDLSPYASATGDCTHYSIVGSRIYAVTKDDSDVTEPAPVMWIWNIDIGTTSNLIENYWGSLEDAVEQRGLAVRVANIAASLDPLGNHNQVVSATWTLESQTPYTAFEPSGTDYIDSYVVKYAITYYAWFYAIEGDEHYNDYAYNTAEVTDYYTSRDWGYQGGVWHKPAHAVYRQSITPLSELIEPPLSDVIGRVCLRAGLEAGDFQTAPEMDDIPVRAMLIGSQSNARGVLDALCVAFGVFYREGNKVDFLMRGADPVLTLAYENLGARTDNEDIEPLNIKPPSPLDIPQKFALRYINVNNDYQPGAAYADREVGEALGANMTEIPVGMTPSEAQIVCDWQKLDARLTSIKIPLSLTDDYLHLECGDVIGVTDRDGSVYRTHIERTTEGDGLQCEVCLDDGTIYSQLGAAHNEDQSSSVVHLVPLTEARLLDIPIQADGDSDAGFYAVAHGETTPWPGAWLWDMSGTDPAHIATFNATAVFGECISVLGNWTGPRVVDETNYVDVDVGYGTLSSSTYSAVLNDASINRFMLGGEEVQAIVCTLLSAGKYRLRRLLRGCRGTEWAMVGTHYLYEPCVKLGAGLKRVPMDASRLGTEREYKAVTLGRQVSGDPTTYLLANMGVGLKPFSPVRLRVVRDGSGNITFGWQRRTRLSVRMIGSLGISVPLGEETEAYTVTVYTDNTYTTVKRTISASSETAAYSAGSQTSDFGSAQSTVYWSVKQLSAAVGAGYEERIAA